MSKKAKSSPRRQQGRAPVDRVGSPGRESLQITHPFDPTQINITAKQMSLDTLIKRIEHKEIRLSPDFQRNEVWTVRTRSRLIESLLIRIPLPAFYMDATNEEEWQVVDGLQRLATLRDFVIEKGERRLTLQGLEFLPLNGRDYDDLERNYQRRIAETQVTVYLIEKGTPDQVKFNVFRRINTGGMPLSAQEIRHALNQGAATTMLKELAKSREFLTATGESIGDKRMADREAVLRALAFIIRPYREYKGRDFDAFLTNAMKVLNAMPDKDRQETERRFLGAMAASHDIFGAAAFRKQELSADNGRLSPINKALLEVWVSQLAALSPDQISTLHERKNRLYKGFNMLLRDNPTFVSAITQGTGKPEKVRRRFEYVEKLIRRVLK